MHEHTRARMRTRTHTPPQYTLTANNLILFSVPFFYFLFDLPNNAKDILHQ